MLGLVLMVLRKRRERAAGDTDEDLMERFRDGDAAAFERLLERHQRGVYNFAFRFINNTELANDLLQETFLRVIKGAPGYSRKARFTTWMYTIARNQCIDTLRKARYRRTASLDQPAPGGDGEGPSLMDRIPGRSDDAHERTDSAEIGIRIQEAIAQLSVEQREVFVMREFRQLQFKEIAAIVGVSENTIKSRMRYALENLRLALADYAENLPGAVDPLPARSRA